MSAPRCLSLALTMAATLLSPLAAVAAGPFSFHTLTPCRILDTRNPAGPTGGPALVGGQTRVFPITGNCGVAAGAKAVAVNATVVAPTGPGHVILYPADVSQPVVSNINFVANVPALANSAIVPLAVDDGDMAVNAFILGGGTVHFVLDVNGYYQ